VALAIGDLGQEISGIVEGVGGTVSILAGSDTAGVGMTPGGDIAMGRRTTRDSLLG
jgi:hypothetical protein